MFYNSWKRLLVLKMNKYKNILYIVNIETQNVLISFAFLTILSSVFKIEFFKEHAENPAASIFYLVFISFLTSSLRWSRTEKNAVEVIEKEQPQQAPSPKEEKNEVKNELKNEEKDYYKLLMELPSNKDKLKVYRVSDLYAIFGIRYLRQKDAMKECFEANGMVLKVHKKVYKKKTITASGYLLNSITCYPYLGVSFPKDNN